MGILNRLRLAASTLATVSVIMMSGCDEDDECANRICPKSATPRPTDPLALDVDVSAGWDSVWVEIHSGDAVENSPLYASWSGADSRSMSVGDGTWSGHAVYIRPGDTLDTYDADRTSWSEETDECDCFEGWSRNDGKLDLRAR